MGYPRKVRRRLKEKANALFVRMPHAIRKQEDVAKLFSGDFKVNTTRQTSRHCYVLFQNKEDKMRNLKEAEGKLVNGKRVIVTPAKVTLRKDMKLQKKKIFMPNIKEDTRFTKILYVSNIKCGTKVVEVKEAFPECVSVKLLKPYTQQLRGAIVKMQSVQIAADYLQNKSKWPTVGGQKLRINLDTRLKKKTKKRNESLKIYDGEVKTEPKSD